MTGPVSSPDLDLRDHAALLQEAECDLDEAEHDLTLAMHERDAALVLVGHMHAAAEQSYHRWHCPNGQHMSPAICSARCHGFADYVMTAAAVLSGRKENHDG